MFKDYVSFHVVRVTRTALKNRVSTSCWVVIISSVYIVIIGSYGGYTRGKSVLGIGMDVIVVFLLRSLLLS